jgi:hypothetical protein
MADKKQTGQTGKQQHDRGYRNIFATKENFIHFLTKYIGELWTADLTVNDLTPIESSYVMKDYGERDSDIIYKCEKKNLFFYILSEQQSKNDFSMPFRLLSYMVNLLTNEFNNTPANIRESKDFRLPAIVPIVMYNGESVWTPVRAFREYTENYGVFGDCIIDFKYILFDLNRQNESDILTSRKLLDFVFDMDLRHNSRTREDFFGELKKLAELKNEMTDDDVHTFAAWLKNVVFRGIVPEDFETQIVTAFRKGEGDVMTHSLYGFMERERVRERKEGRAEGKAEGKTEGILDVALRMLKRGKPLDEIAEDTGLPIEKVKALQS